MKNVFFALAIVMVGSQAYAGIQNGKIVADVVRVENKSLFPIKVNGKKITGGETIFCRVNAGDSYAIENGTMAIELNNEDRHTIIVPVMDKNGGPVTPFGGNLNGKEAIITTNNPNGELQFDIVVSADWIFGQELTVGEKFNKIATCSQAAITALAANKVA